MLQGTDHGNCFFCQGLNSCIMSDLQDKIYFKLRGFMQQSAQLEERISKCNEILSHNSDSLIFAALSDDYLKKWYLSRAFHF